MAKLSREQIKAAIKQQLPGFKVVEQSGSVPDAARERGAAPDSVSPNLERARHKYAGKFPDARPQDKGAGRPGGPAGGDDGAPDDDTSVLLEPENTSRDASSQDTMGPGPKIVILDPEGKVVAEQG